MLPLILTAFAASSASLVTAQEAEFWWSYRPENTSDYGYDPAFEVCGSSCSNCTEDAKSCFADDFSNICYEPARGETCCQDVYGTACYEGFYCAYNSEEIAFCCAKDTEVDDCGALFEETLTSSERAAPTTVVVTAVFTPPVSATESVVARPNRTPPPKIPGTISTKTNSTTTSDEGLSLGAKIGVGVGVFIGVAGIAALVAFLFVRRRRNNKYSQVGGGAGDPLVAHHPSPFAAHATPTPMHAGPSAYEPMRHAPPPEYHAQDRTHGYMISPQPSPQPSVVLPHYSDNIVHSPPSHHQGATLTHLPPPGAAELPHHS